MRSTMAGSGFHRNPTPFFLLLVLLKAGKAFTDDAPDASASADQASSDASPTPVRLTWPDLVRLADGHPRLSAAAHQLSAAMAGVGAAAAAPNPSLEASIAHGQSRDVDRSRPEWGLALNLPLGWLAQRRAKIHAAEAEVDVSRAEAKLLRREVLLRLRTLFWDLVYQQARVAVLEALAQQMAELSRAVKARVAMGEARPVEETRVEVEVEKLAAELEVARLTLTSRKSQLELWLGLRRGQELVAVADLSALPWRLNPDAVLTKVHAGHPALLAGKARVCALAAAADSQRRLQVPAVAVRAFTAHELDRRAYGIGLAIDLPLWNWNSGGIAQAEANLAAGQRLLEAEMREIEAAALETLSSCKSSIKLATRYQDRILPRSESAAATVEKTYQLGEATLFEVIDARRSLLESRHSYLSALVQAQTHCSQLTAAVGEDQL